MTDLVIAPHTGEVIPLGSTTDVLAEWVDDLKAVRQKISLTIDTLADELNQRLDVESVRSARIGEWRIEGKAAFTVEYDPVRLHAAVFGLATDGKLSEGVAARTVIQPAVKDWKVDRREVNKLLRHADPEVRAAVEACAVEKAQKRSINVKRAA
jgi:hypothetical protein